VRRVVYFINSPANGIYINIDWKKESKKAKNCDCKKKEEEETNQQNIKNKKSVIATVVLHC